MGMKTKADIDIAAPRAEVFRWITEHDKVTAWTGSAGAMPEDSSQLKVGYSAAETPGTEPSTTLTVTAWDPPSTFACKVSNASSDATATYTLTEVGSGTHLELTGDTEWVAPDLSAIGNAFAGQDAETAQLVQQFMHQAEDTIAHGSVDPGTVAVMQKAIEDSLVKLKGLIEAARD